MCLNLYIINTYTFHENTRRLAYLLISFKTDSNLVNICLFSSEVPMEILKPPTQFNSDPLYLTTTELSVAKVLYNFLATSFDGLPSLSKISINMKFESNPPIFLPTYFKLNNFSNTNSLFNNFGNIILHHA